MRLFDVEVAARPGGGVSLVLSGELDLSTIQQLEEAVSESVDGRPELVVLDLRKLEFLDSTGLRLMLRLHSTVKDNGGRLVMVEGPRRVHRVFELTRAVDELEIVADPTDIDAQPDLSAGKPS